MIPLKVESVHWELTNHCNLKCVHCYLADDPRRELTTVEVKGIIDQLEAVGCLWITFSGGEPLLRRDFSEIYEYAFDKGFFILIFTSGTRITPKLIETFKARPPFSIEITVNGRTKETFEKVTKIPGSFERCMEGIQMIHDAGLKLTLKTNGMTINIHEAKEIKAFARSLPGVGYKFDAAIMPKRDHDLSPTLLRLKPDQIIALYQEDLEMKEQLKSECDDRSATDGWFAPVDRMVFQCSAARTRFHISAWGDLHPCHTVRPIKVSLLDHALEEAIPLLRARVDAVKYPAGSKCGSCSIHEMCARCPGVNQLETKSSMEVVDHHCETAHKLVENFA